jgi:hypothetical protein
MRKLLFLIPLLFLTACTLQPPLGGDVKKAVYKTADFKRVVKDNPKDKIEVELKDKKLKISRWDDEVNLELTFRDDKKTNKEIKIYDLPISAENPEGAFEFEIDLLEKPETNVMEFDIVTKGLDFFYQPIYTEEEIMEFAKNGDLINRDAMGSYAIYTSESKVNYVGGKEYKAGKVGHIYRPQVCDSSNVCVWGALNIDKNILSVTLDQKFIDTAVYPIIKAAGLTFGYETAGTAGAGGWSTLSAATAGMVDQYTASTGDTITGFSVYAQDGEGAGASDNLAIAAYTVSSGNPTTRLATKVNIVVSGTAYNWYSVTGLSQSMSNGVIYCSAWSGEDYGGLNSINIKYDNGSAPGRFNSTNTTLATTFGVTGTDSGRHYSAYATYTASGGAAPAPAPNNPIIIFD